VVPGESHLESMNWKWMSGERLWWSLCDYEEGGMEASVVDPPISKEKTSKGVVLMLAIDNPLP